MVNTKKVAETIEMLPRLYALTLADDGSPAQDKTVSFNAITICKLFSWHTNNKNASYILHINKWL
jgi:hypothetical protein